MQLIVEVTEWFATDERDLYVADFHHRDEKIRDKLDDIVPQTVRKGVTE